MATHIRQFISGAGIAVTAGLGYYLLTSLSLSLRVGADDLSILWTPTAFVLAFLARLPWRYWIWAVTAFALANLVGNAEVGRSLGLVSLLTLCDVGVPAIAAVPLRRFLNHDEPLSSRGELLTLAVVATAVTIVSASVGVAIMSYAGRASIPQETWRIWATSTLLGLLIVTPIGLAFTARRLSRICRLETAGILGLLAFISWFLFQNGYITGIPARIAVYASLPILLLSGFRTGVLGSAMAITLMGAIGAWQLATGGRLPGGDASALLEQLEWAEAYFATAATSTLVLAVLFEEFQSALRDRATQNRVLEQLVSGAPLENALTELVRSIESRSRGMIGSVLVLDADGTTLRVAAAPGLPHDYNRMVDGIQAGPIAGSCGTAVHRRERVVVADISTDPLWAGISHVMPGFGLRACWSQPIIGGDGQVLGTFAMYYREARSPTAADIRLIESAAQLAGVALERHRMLSALQERERAYSSLVSNLSGMAYRCRVDKGWAVELISDYACTLTGYRPSEFTAENGIHFDRLIHPDDLDSNRAEIHRCLADNCAMHLEYRITTRDGQLKWVWDQAHGVYDARGDAIAIEGIVTDITARKLAEQESIAARKAAEQANRAKDQFLAMLSHELRTPLTPVLLYASSLENDRRLSDEHRRDIRVIRQQVELETRLIDDLLDVTRIQRGKFLVTPQRMDFADVIAKVVQAELPLADEKNLSLGVDLQASSHQMNADPARIQQLVLNLVGNAIKFTPPRGSVTIRTFDAPGDSNRLILEITDTGIGIAPEVLPRLFVAFEQGHRMNSPQYGGLGLGLTIVKAIAEIHGGHVRAESGGENLGARLSVELPRLPSVVADAPTRGAADHAVRPLNILLVEDDKPTQLALQSVLREAGHQTATADTLASALSEIERRTPDLVISDIQLPDGDGLMLMRRLREMKPVVKGIALSGYGSDEDIDRSRRAGFREHLVKPINGQSLAEAIRRATADSSN